METSIKLPQPLASLLVAGAIPAVPLKARLSENRERFLVYATKQVENQDLPIEWIMEAYNHAVYGNIPPLSKLPSSAIVGYVDVMPEPYVDSSIWGKGSQEQLFKVVMPRIFNHPIPVGSLVVDFADVNRFVNLFPAYSIHELNKPWSWHCELEIPVNEALFPHIADIGTLTLDLCGDLKRIVLDENGELRKFNQLTITCGNRYQEFLFHADIVPVLDEDEAPALFPSLLQECGKDIRLQLQLLCEFPLIH